MIHIYNLPTMDKKATKICEKHIHEWLIAGIDFYLDLCSGDEDFRDEFLHSDTYKSNFPKGFSDDRIEALRNIKKMIETPYIINLSMQEKYILMSCLKDYYDDFEEEYSLDTKTNDILNIAIISDKKDRQYVLNALTDEAKAMAAEEGETDYTDALEYLMGNIEDLTRYSYTCFEDCDYELLKDYTVQELANNPISRELGMDI